MTNTYVVIISNHRQPPEASRCPAAKHKHQEKEGKKEDNTILCKYLPWCADNYYKDSNDESSDKIIHK